LGEILGVLQSCAVSQSVVVFGLLFFLKHYRGFSLAVKTRKIVKKSVEQWQVRDESGTVFVAGGFEALKGWVVDGRVSPASEVSTDGNEWIPAVQLRELEMNCVIELEPASFYGPIHLSAMRGLIEAGSVPVDSAFYCRGLEKERSSELYEKGEELKQDLERVSAERELFSGQIKVLETEVAQYQRELGEKQAILEERTLTAQGEVSSLSELTSGLRLQVDALNKERDKLRVEIKALSKNKRAQVKLMKEREMLHQKQLKDVNVSCNLKIKNLILEHESAINKSRHQAVEEMLGLKDSNKALNQQIGDLQQAKSVLEEEFAEYKKLKQCSSSNDAADHKLIVLKNLFAEAALLLDEEDSGGDDESGSAQRNIEEPELIEYEEVSSGEVHVEKITPEKLKSNVHFQGASEKELPFMAKIKRKWTFGKEKNNINHGSMAELEALAQIELQRLSSSQDIASIFEQKK